MRAARRVIERGWAERNNHLDRIVLPTALSDFPPSPRSHRRRYQVAWHLIDGVEKSAKQEGVKIAAGRTRLEIAAAPRLPTPKFKMITFPTTPPLTASVAKKAILGSFHLTAADPPLNTPDLHNERENS